MKKLALTLGMLIMAAVTVWFLNYSEQDNGPKGPKPDYDSKPYTEDIISQLDSLESNQWNKEKFDNILAEIDIMHSHENISDTEKDNLEEGLHSAYAKSLNLSFESWKENCAKSSVNKLYQEIKQSRKHDGKCEEILRTAYSEINRYYQILNVTKKAGQLIKEEFEENSFNSLSQKAEKLRSYFKACSEISGKLNAARDKLDIYHNFVLGNIDNYSAYEFEKERGETIYSTRKKLRSDYGLAQKHGFDFYEKKLKTDGFDN
jgi:hypothetical protein